MATHENWSVVRHVQCAYGPGPDFDWSAKSSLEHKNITYATVLMRGVKIISCMYKLNQELPLRRVRSLHVVSVIQIQNKTNIEKYSITIRVRDV